MGTFLIYEVTIGTSKRLFTVVSVHILAKQRRKRFALRTITFPFQSPVLKQFFID